MDRLRRIKTRIENVCCKKKVPKPHTIYPNHMLIKRSKQKRIQHSVNNEIKTTKYTPWNFIPKNLFLQFYRYANFYFLFTAVIVWIPGASVFGKEMSFIPLFTIVMATAIKDAIEDFRRYKSDRSVNASLSRVWDSESQRYKQIKWKDLKVGDFVHLSCNEVIPADILLLHSSDVNGFCYMEASNLDGESNLKQRKTVDLPEGGGEIFEPDSFKWLLHCAAPDNQIYKFSGCLYQGEKTSDGNIPLSIDNLMLRGGQVKNTDFIEGIVVYTGHNTKSMKNTIGSRSKRSKLESAMNWDILFGFFFLLFISLGASVGSGIWLTTRKDGTIYIPTEIKNQSLAFYLFTGFLAKLVSFQNVVPLSLFIVMEMVKLFHVLLLNNDEEMVEVVNGKKRKVECRALNITEDLGQIQYIMSDKTGTLTENVMVFKACTIAGTDYSEDASEEEVETDLPAENTINKNLKDQCSKLNGEFLSPLFPSNDSDIFAFLLIMAICNTVVVNKRTHEDTISATGAPGSKTAPVTDSAEETQSPSVTPSKSRVSLCSPCIYEAESPDELALVNAAAEFGMKLLERKKGKVVVEMPDGSQMSYNVLNVLKFDAVRKQMSIVIESPKSDSVILLTKGADSSILGRLVEDNRMSHRAKVQLFKANESLQLYSSRGLRTLCLAKKVMSRREYDDWMLEYNKAECDMNEEEMGTCMSKVECDLELLGVTGIEDKLQKGVPECIRAIRKAGIIIWVLTGDKVETAVNIAYSCQLFTTKTDLFQIKASSEAEAEEVLTVKLAELTAISEKRNQNKASKDTRSSKQKKSWSENNTGLVLDGTTLANCIANPKFLQVAALCTSVLCCRASPIQKADMVMLVRKKLNARTMAVGDGANDVSMIQAADVGIGINGLEGRQAVLASDFALPRFRLLKKLLFVHGHWFYDRIARLIPYFLYKNMLINIMALWFEYHNGFSSLPLIDPMFFTMSNLVFSTLPGVVVAMLDQSCEERLLLQQPKLYAVGRDSKLYHRGTYWVTLADTVWQSLVCFFVPYFVYRETSTSLDHFGFVAFFSSVLCTQAHLAIEIRAWMWPMGAAMFFSLSFLVVFSLIYSRFIVPGININPPYFVAHMVFARPVNYLIFLYVVPLAIFFRLTFKIFQNSLRPSSILRARLELKLREEMEKSENANFSTK